jgi:carboxymethylenebutenolidase
MTGKMIDINIRGGGSFKGYLASPASGQGPGVVVIQEIFGVNANIRGIADNLAKEGFFALAPDLFWRQKPGVELDPNIEAEFNEAFKYYQGFDVDKGIEDLNSAMAALRALPGANGKVGCQGYCLGGLLAYLMAARTDVDAAVGYYGVGIDGKLNEASNITKPLMLHIAKADAFVDAAAQASVHKSRCTTMKAWTMVSPGPAAAITTKSRRIWPTSGPWISCVNICKAEVHGNGGADHAAWRARGSDRGRGARGRTRRWPGPSAPYCHWLEFH